MQEIVFEQPYQFIPPHRGTLWPSFIQTFNLYGRYLRRHHGIASHECRGLEKLRHSLAAGHGVLLTPNHCRPADPIVMGFLSREAGKHVYAMASWHLFMQNKFNGWAIRKMGGFSVYREGLDRQAINTSVEVLETAERPLIIFPEGSVTRTNDALHGLLDGVSFIARTAAKKRARRDPPGKVMVHPVAIKYLYRGDLKAAVDPVLTDIEHRLSWHAQHDLPLLDRIHKVGFALLCLKELEYFGKPQRGPVPQRLEALINRLLGPLEEQWLGEGKSGPVVPRVKALRMAILPEMVQGRVTPEERARRWRQLHDIYLSQQVSCYLPDYTLTRPSVTRLLETVERYSEDLSDQQTTIGPLHVIIQVGDPIEVSPQRDRAASSDPLMDQIESELKRMLAELSLESPLYEEPAAP